MDVNDLTIKLDDKKISTTYYVKARHDGLYLQGICVMWAGIGGSTEGTPLVLPCM